jgi:hypothetical protein
LDAQGLEAQGLEAQGLDAQGLEAQGLEAPGDATVSVVVDELSVGLAAQGLPLQATIPVPKAATIVI